MNPMHPETARHEIDRRLRAADEERRRRLARGGLHWSRHLTSGTHARAMAR